MNTGCWPACVSCMEDLNCKLMTLRLDGVGSEKEEIHFNVAIC